MERSVLTVDFLWLSCWIQRDARKNKQKYCTFNFRRFRGPTKSGHVSETGGLLQRAVLGALPRRHGVRRAGGPPAQRHQVAVRGRRGHVPVYSSGRHGEFHDLHLIRHSILNSFCHSLEICIVY